MLKKKTALLMGTCMLTSMFGGALTAQAEEETITFYSWSSGSEAEADTAVCAQYEAEHPGVTVEPTFIPYAEYLSKLNTMAAAGSMPDVFKVPEMNALEWGSKGALLDLKPLYDEAGINPLDEMVPSTVFQSGDSVWGVGCNVATMAVFYNKALFEENGLELPSADPNNPWTWEEYVDVAKKLTKDYDGKTPLDEGFNDQDVMTYGTVMPTDFVKWLPLLYSNNSAIANDEGTELLINTPEGIEVIQAIADLSLVEKCAPDVGTAKGAFADVSAMVMNGQLGMVIDGAWTLGNYANEGFEDLGVAPLPMFDHPANMSWGAAVCMAPENADNKTAFDLLCYYTDFNNTVHSALEQGVSVGCLPHSLDTFDDGENEKAWVSTYFGADYTENCAVFKDIVQQKDNRLGENVTLKNFSVIVDNTIVPLLDNVWLGEMTAEEALSTLDVAEDLQGTWN